MIELKDKSPYVWQRFFNENKSLVYKYIIKKIKSGIDNNLPRVELFKFANQTEPTIVLQSDYEFMLNKAMKIFVDAEEYESANTTKKILDQYYISKLIEESNEV